MLPLTIVITLPNFLDDEASAIVKFLDRPDVNRLHLRKPNATEEEVERLLQAIPSRYYPRIVIHDFFALAQKYQLGGIHLTGRHPVAPMEWRGDVSTSCHSIDELARRKQEGYLSVDGRRSFAYLSLSPIFDSISKQGYNAAFTSEEIDAARRQGIIDHTVLALGGVSFNRIPEVLTMGFGGAMILGDAWR